MINDYWRDLCEYKNLSPKTGSANVIYNFINYGALVLP